MLDHGNTAASLKWGQMTVNQGFKLGDTSESTEGQGCLVKIYPADDAGGLFQLSNDRILIGRDPENCELELPDDAVSRQHASIESVGSGYLITDLGSTNGTFVNDLAIDQSDLRPGDLIRIGSSIFKFLSSNHIEAQYHETVYMMMTTDGLTGAYNKRYLLDAMEREIARSQRYGRPLSVLMLDIDHFKSINDSHGHLVGDEVLKELGRRIRKLTREDEIFARYGGEEFAVVISESGLRDARKVAERIRLTVQADPFVTAAGEIFVTVSLGVAAIHGKRKTTPDELIQHADTKLYEAKAAGRNCVVC